MLAEPGGLELPMLELKDRFEEQGILRQEDVQHGFSALLMGRHQGQMRTFKRRFNNLAHTLSKFAAKLPPMVLG
eukprot:3466716-Pyramimonas_sp.AAC.1